MKAHLIKFQVYIQISLRRKKSSLLKEAHYLSQSWVRLYRYSSQFLNLHAPGAWSGHTQRVSQQKNVTEKHSHKKTEYKGLCFVLAKTTSIDWLWALQGTFMSDADLIKFGVTVYLSEARCKSWQTNAFYRLYSCPANLLCKLYSKLVCNWKKPHSQQS